MIEPADPNSWDARYRRARDHLVPWIEGTVPLVGATVLEYGSGHGPVSCAFAERAERVIGVDIDPDLVQAAEDYVRAHGAENVEMTVHPLEDILDAVRAHRGRVDVFLLYAVLEHLTLEERLAVLELARDVVRPTGAIVVCETPNRLIPFDHHTAQIPFFTMLPDELALRYLGRSPRRDFRAAMHDAARAGPEALRERLVRWGRGVSFHEFELVFGELSEYVIASSYDLALLRERPVLAEELVLARYLERARPDLAPAWSRAWLDVILAPAPRPAAAGFVRPWTMDTVHSPGVAWTGHESVQLPTPDAVLGVVLPHATRRLVVGSLVEAERVGVSARGASMADPVVLSSAGIPGHTSYAGFELPEPSDRIELRLSRPGYVTFVGYEDYQGAVSRETVANADRRSAAGR